MLRGFIKVVSQMEVLRHLQNVHHKAFSQKYLLFTNLSISMSLSCAGDVLEQQYEKYCGELSTWDAERTAHMGVSGLSIGLLCHYWYKFLDSRIPGRTLGIVAKKIFLDQLICSPAYISTFFITLGLLEGKTSLEIVQEIKDKALKLFAAEWIVWPPAQFVNFYWLPSKYRVFYDSLISLGYDVYTSQVKHAH